MIEASSSLLIGASIFSLGLCLLTKFAYEFKVFGSRKKIELNDIYNAFKKENDEISFQTFEETYLLLSKAFRVEAQKIRPKDSMKVYFNLDSWHLSYGADLLEETLVKKYKYTGAKIPVGTVSDFIHIIHVCKKLHNNSSKEIN